MIDVLLAAEVDGEKLAFGDVVANAMLLVQAGLGEAWPQRSSVQHNYRTSSGQAPFRVTATLLFQPTYTVNGVAGPALDPIQVPVTRDYVVHQIQAERTR